MSFSNSNSFNSLASPKSETESTPRADADFPALGAKPQAKPARQPRPAAAAAGGAEAGWETVQGKAPKPAKKQSKPKSKPKQQQPSAFGPDATLRRQREATISSHCVPIILGDIRAEMTAACDWVDHAGNPMPLYQKLWIRAHPANDGMVPIVNKRTGERSMVPVWSQHSMDLQSEDGVAHAFEHDGQQFTVHEVMTSSTFGPRLLAVLRGDDLFTTDTFIQPMVSEKCLFIKFSRHMGPRPAPAAPSRPPAPAAAPLAEAPVSVPAPRPAPRAPWAKDAKGGS